MDFQQIASINLIKGAGGGDPRSGLCIMEMVSYFAGADRVTDHPECACPVLTAFAIRLNDDAPSQEDRDSLKPLLPLLTGSKDASAKKERVAFLVFETARRLVAPLYDKRWPRHAAAIREAASFEVLRSACLEARASAAYAAAYAASAAYYAAAAAYAAASAAAYAASAAYAAYAATVGGGVGRRQAWEISKQILIEAIHLGAHGDLDPLAADTVARAEQLLSLLAD